MVRYFLIVPYMEVGVIDEIVFADKVSALLKGKYAHLPQQEKVAAFNYAFNEVADAMHIKGDARCALKSEVGKVLSKRPRKKRTKTTSDKRPLPSFEVLESDNRSYVIFQTKEPCPSIFRFIPEGWTIRPNNTSEMLMGKAREFAKTFFAECGKNTVRETGNRIMKLEASEKHLSLVLDGHFEICFVKGKRGVCASATKLRVPCKQKDIPGELMRGARAIATAYFKDTGTLPLQFE